MKRFDKKQKKKDNVNCPNIIVEYNRHMGGVDSIDSLIGKYKTKNRSKVVYKVILTSIGPNCRKRLASLQKTKTRKRRRKFL